MAVSTGRIAFACPGKNARIGTTVRSDAGVIYVYTVSTTGVIAYEANLTHSRSLGNLDRLGGGPDALSMFGNTLVAGMPGYESSANRLDTGGAVIFEYADGQWSETDIVTPPTWQSEPSDLFGTSVVARDGLIVVASPSHSPSSIVGGATDAGTLWLYTKSPTGSWFFFQQLNPSSSNASDTLGDSLDMNDDGTLIIASAHRSDAAAGDAGVLHMFSKTSTGTFEHAKTITVWEGALYISKQPRSCLIIVYMQLALGITLDRAQALVEVSSRCYTTAVVSYN